MLPNFFHSCAAHLTGPILRIFSTVLIFFSFSLFLPLFLGLWYQEGGTWEFLYSFLILFFIGILFWFPSRNATKPLQLHQTFILVALVWLCLCFAGALPFLLSDIPGLGIVNSFFESFSGLTTTGASVVVNLEDFSKSLLFYRQLLQWIGGLGIIVIAIGIAPTLGIGAIQLYRVGILHNANDSDKFRPRISGIARSLWVVYLVLTLACALSYWLAGLDVFDAICMSMSTISIGGFVPYSANMGHFVENSEVLLVAMIFMIIAAMNFGLHFLAFSRRMLSHYFKNTEIIIFLGITTYGYSDNGVLSICYGTRSRRPIFGCFSCYFHWYHLRIYYLGLLYVASFCHKPAIAGEFHRMVVQVRPAVGSRCSDSGF